MAKTKIAIFDFSGCEGCEFHLLSLNELLLDVFQDFEITNWRLLSEEEKNDFDIAFIEGAITTPNQVSFLKEIRENCQTLVALGACAISGNFFAEVKGEQRKKLASKIYGKDYQLKAKFLEPVEKYVKVDFKIPGCPPDPVKFKEFLSKLKEGSNNKGIKPPVSPPEYVAKIEGHGQLKVNFKLKKVSLEVEESERLVEGLLLGKHYTKAPYITSRICGICPVAHNLCSWKAIENALKIAGPEEVLVLRELILVSQIIKSHLLHLFFLVLPDFVGLKSAMELSYKYPAEFHLMLNIKRACEKVLKVITGSITFPLYTNLGGLIRPIKKDDLLALKPEIEEVLDEAQDLIKLFSSFKALALKTNFDFLTLKNNKKTYPLYQGVVNQTLKEVVDNSTAKLAVLANNQIIKTGALARLKNFNPYLNRQAKKAFVKTQPDLLNPYNNNLAQAIEILHFLEESLNLIDRLNALDLKKALVKNKPVIPSKEVRGVASLEAPRGILMHQVVLNSQGNIINYNIIPPTQINLASLKVEVQQLVNKYVDFEEKALIIELKKLIRAFDPCITCAVH